MPHYVNLENPTSFRKLAAAMWRPPNDPHAFGSVDIDATRLLDFIDSYNARHGCKVTVTHAVVRAVALTLKTNPEANAKIGWSAIRRRTQVDIFCQVSTEEGRDLSGFKIPNTDQLSLAALSTKLAGAARDIRADKDPAFRRSRNMFKALPVWGVRMLLGLMSLLTNRLNFHLPKLGMPRDPFGSAMVTSVGMLGIDTGFAPFTPIARCPMIITVTRIRPRPWVVEDAVVPRPVLRLCGTFDHRVIDGFHAGELSGSIERLLGEPEELLTAEEQA